MAGVSAPKKGKGKKAAIFLEGSKYSKKAKAHRKKKKKSKKKRHVFLERQFMRKRVF